MDIKFSLLYLIICSIKVWLYLNSSARLPSNNLCTRLCKGGGRKHASMSLCADPVVPTQRPMAHFTPSLLVKRNVRSPKQCLEAGFRFDVVLALSNSTWFAVVFMFLVYDDEPFLLELPWPHFLERNCRCSMPIEDQSPSLWALSSILNTALEGGGLSVLRGLLMRNTKLN